MEVTFERLRAVDAAQLKALEVVCGLSPWDPADIAAEAARPDSLSFTASVDGRIVGFVVARLITQSNNAIQNAEPTFESEIYNLAVHPSFRRRRIARSLFGKMLSAAPGPSSVFLEVREGNEPAIAFYRRVGFEIVGRRSAFYRDPPEAAVLMSRPPGELR